MNYSDSVANIDSVAAKQLALAAAVTLVGLIASFDGVVCFATVRESN